MNNIYDVLEICIQNLDDGAELESVLAHYPDMAVKLRPMIQTARIAKLATIPNPSENIISRNQAKVLQRFDQALGKKTVSRNQLRSWRQVLASVSLLLLFFLVGTNLVRASLNSLPGDSLYPIKRSWERITLLLPSDTQTREKLEAKYEAERIDELHQLFVSGGTAQVEFTGVVNLQKGNEWQVAGIRVVITAQTQLPDEIVKTGNLVHVIGKVRGDDFVFAEQILMLSDSTAILDTIDSDPESATKQPKVTVTAQPGNGISGFEAEIETPTIEHEKAGSPTPTPKIESFEGTLILIDQSIWKIDAIFVEAGNAEIKGIPMIGSTVKVEGYLGAGGIFIASKLEILSNVSDNTNTNSNNVSSNSNSSNGNDDNSNDKGGNSNSNSNDNGDDNGGGGTSGSGKNDNGGGNNNGN